MEFEGAQIYQQPVVSDPLRLLRPVRWCDEGLLLLDQRCLPAVESYLHFSSSAGVAQAITAMVVRGAPAIGLAAAYGAVLAAKEAVLESQSSWLTGFTRRLTVLAESRPTAVNLRWALQQMTDVAVTIERDRPNLASDAQQTIFIGQLTAAADQLLADDLRDGELMAGFGAEQIEPGSRVLTHCNAGGLATGGVGTALGVINEAWKQDRIEQVYASETRPWFQGARLTAWELQRQGIETWLLVEGAVAALMRERLIDWLIVGADRVVANGDVANKIGTYSAALLARHHGVKVMVVAPSSTFDLETADGDGIVIEQRSGDEVTDIAGQRMAADGVAVWNPVFDVTPAALIDCIVTEKGVLEAPFQGAIQRVFG